MTKKKFQQMEKEIAELKERIAALEAKSPAWQYIWITEPSNPVTFPQPHYPPQQPTITWTGSNISTNPNPNI